MDHQPSNIQVIQGTDLDDHLFLVDESRITLSVKGRHMSKQAQEIYEMHCTKTGTNIHHLCSVACIHPKW